MIKAHDIFLLDISYFPAHFLASTSVSVCEVGLHLFSSNTKTHQSRVNPRWPDIENVYQFINHASIHDNGKVYTIFFPSNISHNILYNRSLTL